MADDRQPAIAATEATIAHDLRVQNAMAQAATLDTLRRAASDKADRDALEGGSSRFGFYLVTGILLATLVVTLVWLR